MQTTNEKCRKLFAIHRADTQTSKFHKPSLVWAHSPASLVLQEPAMLAMLRTCQSPSFSIRMCAKVYICRATYMRRWTEWVAQGGDGVIYIHTYIYTWYIYTAAAEKTSECRTPSQSWLPCGQSLWECVWIPFRPSCSALSIYNRKTTHGDGSSSSESFTSVCTNPLNPFIPKVPHGDNWDASGPIHQCQL